jgi:hypothetical protein
MAKLRLKTQAETVAVAADAEWVPAALPVAAPAGPAPSTIGQGLDGSTASVNDIVLFIKQLCLAYSHLAYYPADHPVAMHQMTAAWKELKPVFAKFGDVSISLTEGKLLFFGMPVEERNPAVAKFARHFEELHVHSIKFHQGLTLAEFSTFFVFFCKDPRLVHEAGGVQQLIASKGICNISFNAAVYRVIEADEKIVKKADVYRGQSLDVTEEKGELMKYFVARLLEHAEDKDAFLNDIKNDPERIAEQIVRILEEVGEGDALDRETMVEALLGNIQMVTESISLKSQAGGAATAGEAGSLAAAMMQLENELQRKSKNLNSQASVRFIKRITDVVSSYTDRVKADRVLGEFLRNEKSLRAAESMMGEICVDPTGGRRIIDQVRTLMKEKGLSEDELIQHLENHPAVKPPPRKRAKAARAASHKFKPLAERIRGKLDHEFKDVQDKERLVEYLDTLYQRETARLVAEKTESLRHEAERAATLLHDVKNVFAQTNLGMILFDDDGKIGFLEHAEALPWPLTQGEPLPAEASFLFSTARERLVDQRLGHAVILEVLHHADGRPEAILFRREV